MEVDHRIGLMVLIWLIMPVYHRPLCRQRHGMRGRKRSPMAHDDGSQRTAHVVNIPLNILFLSLQIPAKRKLLRPACGALANPQKKRDMSRRPGTMAMRNQVALVANKW